MILLIIIVQFFLEFLTGRQRRLRTLSGDESSPIEDIVYAFKLLLDKCDNNSTRIVLSKLRSIFGSKAVSEVFTYFCLHGAATARTLRKDLNMSETTAYRALKQLRTLGFIVPALKVKKVNYSKGGPLPTVWALEGASQEEIDKVYHEMRKSRREATE